MDARIARMVSEKNEMVYILKLIKEAADNGKRKILIDEPSPEAESKLQTMKYTVYQEIDDDRIPKRY